MISPSVRAFTCSEKTTLPALPQQTFVCLMQKRLTPAGMTESSISHNAWGQNTFLRYTVEVTSKEEGSEGTSEPLRYFSNHQQWWFTKEVKNKSPFLPIVFCREVLLHCPSFWTTATHISSIFPASQIGYPADGFCGFQS